MGDIKLVAVIGLATGMPLALAALFIGIVIGGLAAIVLLVLQKKGRKTSCRTAFFWASARWWPCCGVTVSSSGTPGFFKITLLIEIPVVILLTVRTQDSTIVLYESRTKYPER
jgi:hypothetical protein